MDATLLDRFPPLGGAIAQAEAWTRYLKTRQPDGNGQRIEAQVASLESLVGAGVKLGEMLPFTWRLAFDNMVRTGDGSWTTVKEFESVRQAVHRLFFTTREALDATRQVAEALRAATGSRPTAMDRLLQVIEEARELEEAVFRDWPSFADPQPPMNPAEALPVDEALAETLGISVEEARRHLDARRQELSTERGLASALSDPRPPARMRAGDPVEIAFEGSLCNECGTNAARGNRLANPWS